MGHYPKSVVVVRVVWIVPVAVGAADVVLIVVSRPAPQHAASHPAPTASAIRAGHVLLFFCHAASRRPISATISRSVVVLTIGVMREMRKTQIETHLGQAASAGSQPVQASARPSA